jgi:hypothetical protein
MQLPYLFYHSVSRLADGMEWYCPVIWSFTVEFVVVVIIIIIIIIFVMTFMLCIYSYIPETNHVSRVYTVTAVLYLQLVLHVMLLHKWNMFCSFTLALSACSRCAVHNMAVFCISLILCYPSMKWPGRNSWICDFWVILSGTVACAPLLCSQLTFIVSLCWFAAKWRNSVTYF